MAEARLTKTLLKLGRVSNLPTVWSNLLMVCLVCGTEDWASAAVIFSLMIAGSMAYVGGMFLNDAFDAKFDKAHQPFRPIPSGLISQSTVFTIGFGLLFLSAYPFVFAKKLLLVGQLELTLRMTLLYLALLVTIVSYNWIHKRWSYSFLIMAGARASLVLLTAEIVAFEVSELAIRVATAEFVYVCALTIIARNEAKLPLFKGKIALLIAGICLFDLLLVLATAKSSALAPVFIVFFVMTILLQRWIRGT